MLPIPTKFFVNRAVVAATLGLLLPAAAVVAHPLHGDPSGFAGGILHPLLGLDHLIALLAVGLWSAEQQGQNRWWIPLTFLGMMVVGAVVGMQTGAVAVSEHLIVSSVLVLGGIIAMMWRPSLPVGLPVLSVFALAHGAAHGAEMPAAGSPIGFILGFSLAAAGVIAAGFASGTFIRRAAEPKGMRIAGLAIVMVGCFLLLL
ncbi:MAG: HupE/UreJ family protein [Armatimonadetes bacterium]|nr:HupE/UreJ family protein [Armatimonadota bacterium]